MYLSVPVSRVDWKKTLNSKSPGSKKRWSTHLRSFEVNILLMVQNSGLGIRLICQEKKQDMWQVFSGWPEWHIMAPTKTNTGTSLHGIFFWYLDPQEAYQQDLRKLKPIQEGEYLMYSCKSRLAFLKWNYFKKHSQRMEWRMLFCFALSCFHKVLAGCLFFIAPWNYATASTGHQLDHVEVGNNALKIMDWILEEMAQSLQGSDDRDLRNAYLWSWRMLSEPKARVVWVVVPREVL